MKDNNTIAEVEAKEASTKLSTEVEDEDFLAGAQAADPESFNVCISCD